MNNCIFCKFHKKNQSIVHKNNHFFIRFDDFPVSPGHLEIIPIRHIVSFFDLNLSEWKMLKSTITQAVKIITNTNFKNLYESSLGVEPDQKKKKFYKKILKDPNLNKKPKGYNIGVNEGKAAGRTVNHLHIHIIPRHFKDVNDCVGGIRCVIPHLRNYKK